jgi:MFS family permease
VIIIASCCNVLLMLARYKPVVYLTGATIARTADDMSGPALLLLGLAVLGSTQAASVLYAALTISAAMGGPLLGVLLDRATHPGRLLAWALIGYSGGLAFIAGALGHAPFVTVVAVAVAAGFFAPALSGGWTSRLEDVMPAHQLIRGHSLDAATYNAASLVGPALAGVVTAGAGPWWAMAAAAGLLVLAAPAAWTLPRPAQGHSDSRPSVMADLIAGLTAITHTPPLLRVTLASATAYLGTGMLVVACPLLGSQYLGGAGRGGLLLSVLAVASLIATTVTARWPLPLRPDLIFLSATAIAGCGLLGLALVSNATLVIAAVAVVGIADGPQLAAVFAIRHLESPPRLRGQVFTTGASLKITAGALGAVLAGALAEQSTTLLIAVAAATQMTALICFTPVPSISRHANELE